MRKKPEENMSKHSPIRRLLALCVLAGLILSGTSALSQEAEDAGGEDAEAQGTYPHKDPEQINIDEVIRRRREALLARHLIGEAEVDFKKEKYRDAIDKLSKAETILKGVSKSHPSVRKDLEEVGARLQEAYHQHAKALIEKAKDEIDVAYFDSAKKSIEKAVDYDPSFRDTAEKLHDKIAELERFIEIQQQTIEENIDPDDQDRLKDILILKSEARVFRRHKRYKQARDSYEKVLLKDPTDEEAIKGLDQLYRNLRQTAKRRRRAAESERMAEIEWKWIDPIPPKSAERPGEMATAQETTITVDAPDVSAGAQNIRKKLQSFDLKSLDPGRAPDNPPESAPEHKLIHRTPAS